MQTWPIFATLPCIFLWKLYLLNNLHSVLSSEMPRYWPYSSQKNLWYMRMLGNWALYRVQWSECRTGVAGAVVGFFPERLKSYFSQLFPVESENYIENFFRKCHLLNPSTITEKKAFCQIQPEAHSEDLKLVIRWEKVICNNTCLLSKKF